MPPKNVTDLLLNKKLYSEILVILLSKESNSYNLRLELNKSHQIIHIQLKLLHEQGYLIENSNKKGYFKTDENSIVEAFKWHILSNIAIALHFLSVKRDYFNDIDLFSKLNDDLQFRQNKVLQFLQKRPPFHAELVKKLKEKPQDISISDFFDTHLLKLIRIGSDDKKLNASKDFKEFRQLLEPFLASTIYNI